MNDEILLLYNYVCIFTQKEDNCQSKDNGKTLLLVFKLLSGPTVSQIILSLINNGVCTKMYLYF